MFYNASEDLIELSEIFLREGFHLYVVGGAVRDYILKRENYDVDLTTDAKPEDIKRIFPRTIDTGIKHGTVTIVFRGKHYETTTFRVDGTYLDSRHPENVSYTDSLSEDLRRRDFTINALAASLPDGAIIDQHNGLEDLKNRVIRAIGDPDERFNEDALRIMRASRFASKLNFSIEENTLSSMTRAHYKINRISKERIKEELFRLLDGERPDVGLEYLYESKVLMDLFPQLYERGIQEEKEALKRASHLFLDATHKMAILFRNVKEYAPDYLDSLKCSKAERETVLRLLKYVDLDLASLKSGGSIRRLINDLSEEDSLALIDVREAIYGVREKEAEDRIKKELESNNPRRLSDLKINGNELKELGFKGEEIGKTLSMLLDRVIDDPSVNERETLISIALNES